MPQPILKITDLNVLLTSTLSSDDTRVTETLKRERDSIANFLKMDLGFWGKRGLLYTRSHHIIRTYCASQMNVYCVLLRVSYGPSNILDESMLQLPLLSMDLANWIPSANYTVKSNPVKSHLDSLLSRRPVMMKIIPAAKVLNVPVE